MVQSLASKPEDPSLNPRIHPHGRRETTLSCPLTSTEHSCTPSTPHSQSLMHWGPQTKRLLVSVLQSQVSITLKPTNARAPC